MTYFVTGATGFIGRHLVQRLLDREGDVYVLVRESSQEKLTEMIQAGRLGPADCVLIVLAPPAGVGARTGEEYRRHVVQTCRVD